MSILFESNNCILISHEKYIKKIYRKIHGKAYFLKENFFYINQPFKSQNMKRKRKLIPETAEKFHKLKKDSLYIQKTYSEFKDLLIKNCLILPEEESGQDNTEALNEVSNIFLKTSKNVIRNQYGGNVNDSPIIVNLNGDDYLFPANSKFYCKNIYEIQRNLPNLYFDLILLDPPWWNKAVRRKKLNSQGYDMMYNNQIKEIPIKYLLNENGIVIIWCTNSPQQLECVTQEFFPKWGLKSVIKWFWLKITKSGEPIINFAEPPTKLPFEQILIGCMSKNEDLEKSEGKIIVSVPSAIHSHKPPLIEILKPFLKEKAVCLEIFGRYLLPNWTTYGLEALKLQNLDLYTSNEVPTE